MQTVCCCDYCVSVSKESTSILNSLLLYISHDWRGGRVVECARLEIEFRASERGFESHPLRILL